VGLGVLPAGSSAPGPSCSAVLDPVCRRSSAFRGPPQPARRISLALSANQRATFVRARAPSVRVLPLHPTPRVISVDPTPPYSSGTCFRCWESSGRGRRQRVSGDFLLRAISSHPLFDGRKAEYGVVLSSRVFLVFLVDLPFFFSGFFPWAGFCATTARHT